jgi:hypothetical protein
VQDPPNQPAHAGPPPMHGPGPQALDAVTKAHGKTSHGDSVSAMHRNLRIAHITDSLQIIAYLESVQDPASQKVTGRLDHFSDYAIAW